MSALLTPSDQGQKLSEENFRLLQGKIYQSSGIVIERQKEYLLEARLAPMLRKRNLGSLNDLAGLLRSTRDPAISTEFVESLTTHESYFFRDEAQFDLLGNKVIPELLEKRQTRRKLSFWSAAASSGQEAYSIAITAQSKRPANWGVEILATDLSERILERAREGRYTAHEVSRGPFPEKLKPHFASSGNGYLLSKAIRDMVQFRKFDLRQDMLPLGCFDVIFCRNVLIYFDTPTKARILESLAGVLAPDGILFLGSTESVMSLTNRFVRKTVGNAVYYHLVDPGKPR